MSDMLNFVPVSRHPVPSAAAIHLNTYEKHHYEQLLDQFTSSIAFWRLEGQTMPGLTTVVEDEEKMDKLQEELENIKLFSSGIAHDLGNLFTVIMGNLDLLRLLATDPGLAPYFDQMEKALSAVQALNSRLSHISQSTAPDRKPVKLGQLIIDATELGLFGSAVEHSFNLSDQLPPMHLDPCQISQVIENLALNAAQAMPGGGRLEVEASPVELATGQCPGLTAGKYVEIRLSDTGPGIPAQHLNVIFAPHFTTKPQGQGLGLALCYAIIKRHQGHICVESKPGEGTTFRIWLPVSVVRYFRTTP